MKKAYLVIDVTVSDVEGMRPYREKVEDTFKAFGGKRIVGEGLPDAIEGAAPKGRVSVIEFPSIEAARSWHSSPAYQAIVGIRHANAAANAFFVEGLEAA